MDHLVAARAQMGTSLAFHYIFAALGVGLPVLLLVAEGLWLRTGDRTFYALARTWSRAMALLFAIGAVSGTTLSFELGLLWPEFMKYAGAVVGLPFSAEGFAFFVEAIFVGIYLYGWDRLTPLRHWLCGIPIAISGALSAAFVTDVNAWMNTPAGIVASAGKIVAVDPWVAVLNSSMPTEVVHGTLSAYVFTGFAVAAVYAFGYVRQRDDRFALAGIRIGMLVAAIAIPLQIVAGDASAKFDARVEPLKLAAAEGQFHTERSAPLEVGGWPDEAAGVVRFAIRIPAMLSVLAYGNPQAEVRGLDIAPPADRPPVAGVHLSFDAMVGCGFALLFVAAWWAWFTRLGIRAPADWFARVLVASGFLAFVAMEAGWMVTEEGRQPWIARGLLRTSQAVTTAPALDLAFYGFSLLYAALAATLAFLLLRIRHDA